MSVNIKLTEPTYDKFVDLISDEPNLDRLRYELSKEKWGVTIDAACNSEQACGIALALDPLIYESDEKNIRDNIFISLNKAIKRTAKNLKRGYEAINLLGTGPDNKDSPNIIVYKDREAARKELLKDSITH